jgi:type 1 glutamine amidotransferase/cytochrome c551/c552
MEGRMIFLMRTTAPWLPILLSVSAAAAAGVPAEAPPAGAAPRKIVLIAGPITGHPKHTHEYERSVILLKHLLDTSPNLRGVRTEAHFRGWPADPATLEDADTIVLISDGGDRREEDHPLYAGDRLSALEKQVRRGCGLLHFHWTTFHPRRHHERITEWVGGYFDYESGDAPNRWYSAIRTGDWKVELPSPLHPICRGVRPFALREEFYYKLRFRDGDPRLTPITVIGPQERLEMTTGWAVEREDGGRGFGFTGGHFFANWWVDDYRRLILNAIVWTARAEVPEGGVESQLEKAARVLILTGHNHPAHDWRRVTEALVHVLEQDPRLEVEVSEEIEDLASERLQAYDLLVLNYSNWERPGLSAAAKASFVKYLAGGGGLAVIHFASGAFHYSLPAKDSDWEEYRTAIVRRVWVHGDGESGHDPLGPFRVEITPVEHPITRGLESFETYDELYFRQQGELPIEPLATARSRVTARDEPMAWAYGYGKGRVFQTVLGHEARSIRLAAALIRRGAVWAAGRPQLGFDPPAALIEHAIPRQESQWSLEGSLKRAALPPPAAAPARRTALAEGRFGKGLSARSGGLVLGGRSGYREPPITVECWAKLDSRASFNILVASEPKSSSAHWELYSYAGSGVLSAYLPGRRPAEIRSDFDICDGRWHYLAFTYEPERVRLYAGGRLVKEQALDPAGGEPPPRAEGLAIGSLVEGGIGCDGVIDEVRISRGARQITQVPAAPFERDRDTLGLWRFDAIEELEASARKPQAGELPALRPATPGLDGGIGGHWGVESEPDWADDRFSRMELGRFVTSSLATPGGLALRAISIRLGELPPPESGRAQASEARAAVCFDTATLTLRAGWTGGFLAFSPARFGLIEMPAIAGEVLFHAPPGPAWGQVEGRWRGLFPQGERVVLAYEIGDRMVRESPWIEEEAGLIAFRRDFEIGPSRAPRRLEIVEVAGACGGGVELEGTPIAFLEEGGTVTAAALAGGSGGIPAELRLSAARSRIALELPAQTAPLRFKLLLFRGRAVDLPRFAALLAKSPPPADLEALSLPGGRRWKEDLVTRGAPSDRGAAYVIDTLTLPYENPYRALLFLSGLDFFSNGDAAVSTVHGDVWTVSGSDDRLEKLVWRRFATGLYQPLGLRIAGDLVYVRGRDQITRLHDRNGDGEADHYENFNDAGPASAGGHDYVACLETDAAGIFYYVSPEGLHRVSAGGSRHETLASGWRNPNGLSVSPDGVINVAPQEGEWTPASAITEVKLGGYYGYGGPRITAERPLGYDPPLVWIPRHIDNSTGGQVWITSESWGPLSGQLLSFSYGRSSMQLVLRDRAGGLPQGGIVPLSGRFLSGAMRGRIHPLDGQLYVAGMNGWVTNAVADGCLQRVRYTGRKVRLPLALGFHEGGIRIGFSVPLSRRVAEDPASYAIEVWNYRYTSAYGSEEYSVAHPESAGHDALEVRSARLLDDGRSVFVAVPGLQPVMQLHLRGALEDSTGEEFSFDIYGTAHRLAEPLFDAAEDEEIAAPAAAGSESIGSLPGLALTLTSLVSGEVDARPSRLAALRVPEGASPSPFLPPGPFTAVFEGSLELETRSRLRFSAEGRGSLRLSVSGTTVLEGESDDFASLPSIEARFERGRRAFLLVYTAPPAGDAAVRLYWSGPGLARETVPPGAFVLEGDSPLVARGRLLREARELVAAKRCLRCHPPRGGLPPASMPELSFEAPSLRGIGSRLHAGWMAEWVLDPKSWRPDAAMPALPAAADGRQEAADIASFLSSLSDPTAAFPHEASVEGEAEDLLVARGTALFGRLGCAACHLEPHASSGEEAQDRLPLAHLGARWKTGALGAFLAQPDRHYASIRMPDFRLSPAEALELESFLLAGSRGPVEAAAGDPERGRELVMARGCLNCHELELENRSRSPSFEEIAAADWSAAGCAASGSSRGRGPDLGLGERQREALLELARGGLQALFRRNLIEFSERRIRALRCMGCHDRDGERARWSEWGTVSVAGAPELAAAGLQDPLEAPPQRPALTFTGDQFETPWLAAFLAGKLDSKPRPWLAARMPAFRAEAALLAEGLALGHGQDPRPPPPEPADGALQELGARLLGAGGFSCTSCHPAGVAPAPGEPSFKAISLAVSRQRLRKEFYLRWMINPQRISPRTPMPAYADEEGRSVLTGILDGDAARQFDAIWRRLEARSAAGVRYPSSADE